MYGWAQQNAIKAGQDAIVGRGTREAWEEAKQQMEVVGWWLTAVKLLQVGERRGRAQAGGADIDGLRAIAARLPRHPHR